MSQLCAGGVEILAPCSIYAVFAPRYLRTLPVMLYSSAAHEVCRYPAISYLECAPYTTPGSTGRKDSNLALSEEAPRLRPALCGIALPGTRRANGAESHCQELAELTGRPRAFLPISESARPHPRGCLVSGRQSSRRRPPVKPLPSPPLPNSAYGLFAIVLL